MIRLHMQITSLSRALFVALVTGTLVSAYADPAAQTPAPKTDASPAVSPAAQANSPKRRSVSPDSLKKRELTMLRKSVTLTPDEETKVTPIISNYVDAEQVVKSDAVTTTAEKRAKRKELHDQYVNNVKAVLTPEQAQTAPAPNESPSSPSEE
jgi:Spy/CpxP family protein refolding chaperone